MNALSQVATTLDAPFRGLVIAGRAAGHPLLWEDVIAIGVYTVAAWLVSRLILGAIAGRRQRAALA